MKHNIGILGFGTVGQGITEILLSKKETLKNKFVFRKKKLPTKLEY